MTSSPDVPRITFARATEAQTRTTSVPARAKIESFRIPIIVGVWPFDSVRNAEFMANEVPGVTVPDAVLARMRRAADDDAAEAEGIRIARELRAQLVPMAQGVHISSPSGRTTAALAVLQE